MKEKWLGGRRMSKLLTKWLSITLCIMIVLGTTGCKPWTIVKNETKEDDGSIKVYFSNDDFDADAFARDIWDNQLVSYYDIKKQDLGFILESLKDDDTATGNEYGIGSNETGSSWSFIIDGTVKILEVDTESRAGTMLVDVQPYDGIADAIIQIGPVIKGTTIRDTLESIKLDDFNNQVEFASISKAFNTLVMEKVIMDKDYHGEVNRELYILGAFTYSDPNEILITPIQIGAQEGN